MAQFRILVIRLSSMGDVIHTLPAVASLKLSFPHSRLSWLIRPHWMPLLESNPFVDEVIPMERSLSATLAGVRSLRQQHFDLAVDFQGLVQTALVGAAVHADKLAGFDRHRVRERAAAWFYSSEIATQGEHAVERNLELAGGAGASNQLRAFPLPEGVAEGMLPDRRFVLACPLAGWGAKQWPLEYYEELAAKIDMPLVVNGPPDSAPLLMRIRGVHLHLSGIGGLIHATRKALAVVGVDSGPMHLAAALGKPGVAIYGPTNPLRHGPYGNTIHVLRDPEALTHYARRATPDESMRAILPGDVADALSNLIVSGTPSSDRSPGCPA